MTPRTLAIAVAVFAIALTLAQDVRPGLDVYHTWQYAAALALAFVIVAAHVRRALRGRDGADGKPIALALAGALVIAAGGLLAGLIGPDTVVVSGPPGTVVPVADAGGAAFFAPADAATIGRGDGVVEFRRRAGERVIGDGRPVYSGTSILYRTVRPAAFVVARDAAGSRVTVTQPAGAAFLSPVLLFPHRQPIRDKTYPLDTFALPALHRIVRALYFSAADAATFNHVAPGTAALVLSIDDEHGKTLQITVAPSQREVSAAGIRITATVGSYPQLSVAAAPHPAVLGAGLLLIAVGAGLALLSTAKRWRTGTARILPPA